ncbi:MAG: aminomethyl-transferring glycine dehydrogenase subunit GcvPA [Limnochordia bacterium]|nr:aminomethyl-transferring glycine dehydrogenase subunit GcvPA [Limnochordia bacterium]MDI9466086.1 aminomethyl-transferring glycine dehydrogenase subunit GcvPA [Bacillota bacterium]NLO96398.1 aminomethyl-transferring glycine dehydrogenase subunit GcvPA [Bacillota bacterium]HAI52004.1 aminomethyl-transferring glycine dehydrogenase subunit GcvPA [Bacillota bacterium]HAN94502.1 aminomethyl-transferring glycine dehydrogenase subunit GcvPA [Bacillota bacterium]
MRYIPITEDERREMLTSLGLEKIDDLFQDIPQEAIFQGELDVPGPLSEAELIRHFRELAAKNQDATKLVSFLGAGVYDHLTPSIIKHIIGRGEFLTAYTPYQPEITQGVLQSIFEYQTMICELTAMDAANASMYDGASALAEACLMACAATRRELVILPATLHPEWQEVVRLYLENQDVAMVYLPQDPQTGTVDLSRLDEVPWAEAACVVVQQPNFFGLLEPVAELEKRVHENGGLLVMAVDPISLSLLKPPGELNADIVVGDGQSLGQAMGFGGPAFGFFATTDKLIRRMPGRVVGETVDAEGKRAFVLTLQTREQHIRREKATSNICSNQALNALAATIYLSVLGKQGFRDVGYQCLQKTHYLKQRLLEIPGLKAAFSAPSFREFALRGAVDWAEINRRLLDHGFLGGLPLARFGQPELALFSVTEARTKAEMDAFVSTLRGLIS